METKLDGFKVPTTVREHTVKRKVERSREKFDLEQPKCPKCGSAQVYYRRILKEFVCRRCGHTCKAEG